MLSFKAILLILPYISILWPYLYEQGKYVGKLAPSSVKNTTQGIIVIGQV